jgi:hypothetical protein
VSRECTDNAVGPLSPQLRSQTTCWLQIIYPAPDRAIFAPKRGKKGVNQTAILHTAFGVLLVAGFLASGQLLSYGLYGLGAVCFIAGIVLAQRDGDGSDAGDSA